MTGNPNAGYTITNLNYNLPWSNEDYFIDIKQSLDLIDQSALFTQKWSNIYVRFCATGRTLTLKPEFNNGYKIHYKVNPLSATKTTLKDEYLNLYFNTNA